MNSTRLNSFFKRLKNGGSFLAADFFAKIIIAPAVARVFIALLYKSDVMRMPIAPVATVIATIIPRFFQTSVFSVNAAIKFAGTRFFVNEIIVVIVFSEKKNLISPVDIRVFKKSSTVA